MPLCAAARALRKTRGSSTTSVFEDPLGVETGRGKAKTDGDYANACSAHTAGDIRSLTCFLPADVTQAWVRGHWADALNSRGFSTGYKRRIPGVCLCGGGGFDRVRDREDLLRR